ncbi:similar to Saccharomyces cerevisiae YLR057W Putative protein of unknown function [Maudiozyma saulgeensis]|uniref:alpha-1,2-Mannosidase n=1 Tax=Maudiozyma saulgeensis TaxID=1789683 RepID=A0A1X7R318_9SACH|nr:similar to Saccharomyces cerevisiae YLR057W Putative protein of unknown function [Kazachstania saulgeensis]
MSISKLFFATIRKVKSVLLLTITISTLFYYTFQNEIDILNSYAENEYLPSINNEHIEHSTAQTSELISNLKSINNNNNNNNNPVDEEQETVISNKISIDLTDPLVLKEKNKYFPLWLKSPILDPTTKLDLDDVELSRQDLINFKEKYPLMYEISLSSFYRHSTMTTLTTSNEDEKNSNTVQLYSNRIETRSYVDDREEIRTILLKSWDQQKLHLLSIDHGSTWPIDEVDSMDTLFLMGETLLFQKILNTVTTTDFKVPPMTMEIIDIVDLSTRLLGGLLSAYELSEDKILLTKAKDLADFLLRAFDTPNRVGLLQYSWKTPFKNRFAYMDASIADLIKMSSEFTRLTQLTGSNKYFNTMFHLLIMSIQSTEYLTIESIFPDLIDASTCSLVTNEDVQKGDHQRDSRIMKSIDENLKFIHCHQLTYFPESSSIYKLDSNLLPLYDTLLQLYALTQTDLLEPSDRTSMNSSYFYHSAMEQMDKFFKFQPMHPQGELEDLIVMSNLNANPIFSPSTNDLAIQLRRDFKFHPESCVLGATLSYGSKLFPKNINNDNEMKLADQLTSSCFKLAMSQDGALAELSLDPCITRDCIFNQDDKLKDIKDGRYVGFENGFPKDTVVELMKTDTNTNKKIKRSIIDSSKEMLKEVINMKSTKNGINNDINNDINNEKIVPSSTEIDNEESTNMDDTITKSFHFIDDETFMNIHLSDEDIDKTAKTWKNHPERPLWINSVSNSTLLSPNLIKSIFFLYRTTGDEKWRQMGSQLKDQIIVTMEKNNMGAKGTWKIADLKKKSVPLPSYWFSQTLKYYYLLFSEPSDYSLDEYIYTEGAHLLKRRVVEPPTMRDKEQL